MSANIHIGGATVDGMSIDIHRRLNNERPYALVINDLVWSLTVDEARKLARAATFHPLRSGERKPGARYRGHAAGDDGRVFLIELGVESGEAGADALYFSFDGERTMGRIGEGGELEWLFERLAADISSVLAGGRAFGPQQMQVDLRNYKSPWGWDGS